jgi:hypothetical protein
MNLEPEYSGLPEKKNSGLPEKNHSGLPENNKKQEPIFKVYTNFGVIEMGPKVLIHAMMLGQRPNFFGNADQVIEQYNQFRDYLKQPRLTQVEESLLRKSHVQK